MKQTNDKFGIIKDFAILATILTGSLYYIGYLYEISFIEYLGLRAYGFFPESSSILSFGFRYVFTKTIGKIYITSMYLILFLSLYLLLKKDIKFIIKKLNQKNNDIIKTKLFFDFYTTLKPFLILSIPLFAFLLSFKIVSDAKDGAQNIITSSKYKDVLIVKFGKNKKTITGQSLRHRNGKIAFYSLAEKSILVYPNDKIIELQYSPEVTINIQPNEPTTVKKEI